MTGEKQIHCIFLKNYGTDLLNEIPHIIIWFIATTNVFEICSIQSSCWRHVRFDFRLD